MRRATLIVLLALAVPATASAQEPTPIVGGGSFNAAPVLESGAYSDTLLPAERLYYGVTLEPGQRMRVAAELDVDDDKYNDYAAGFSLGVQTPLREVDVDAVDDDITGNTSVGVDFDERLEYITPPALTKSGADEASGGIYRGPGTWFVSLFLTTTDERPRRIEFPVRLEVEVLGEPQADPEPEPTPAQTPAPAPEQEDEADDGGSSIGALLGLGAIGLVVGLVGGAVAGRRRS